VKKSPFHSTDIRPCLAADQNSEAQPGPGAYDMNFKEELNTLDQKYSQRYKKNPFGSKASRFNKANLKQIRNSVDLSLQNEPVPKNRTIVRNFIDDTIE